MEEMTIVAAMKKLKVIKKRMQKNATLITQYSSQPDSEKPMLNTVEEQKKEVKSLIQANEDLAKDFIRIHTALTFTNLQVIVDVDGKKYTIHELILMRRELHTLLKNTYAAMNDKNYETSMRRPGFGNTDNKTHVERFYDEKWKQDKIRSQEDLYHSIDSRLENINATTNLVPVNIVMGEA